MPERNVKKQKTEKCKGKAFFARSKPPSSYRFFLKAPIFLAHPYNEPA